MVSPDGRHAIAFNGEIYNYVELRAELQGEGVEVRGDSDTAVLLSALGYWGIDALSKLRGMFAFAWWRSDGSVLLARDRAGKKPLYYTHARGDTYFASEIKALRRVPTLVFDIDPASISHYLSLGYVPSPGTAYRQVSELPPGHSLLMTGGQNSTPSPYWQLPIGPRQSVKPVEAVEAVEERLEEAVRIRLRADVPVGAFLSGGIDSGLITAMAARHASGQLKTFTVGFDGAAADESDLARSVAQRYGTEHHEIRLSSDLDVLLPDVVRAYDEPIADTSILPTYAIAREASSVLKVVLNGEGADEQFGGYRRHLAIRYHARIMPLTKWVPSSIWRGLQAVLPVPGDFRTPYAFAHRFLRGIGQSASERYISWSSDGFSEAEKTGGRSGLESSAMVPTAQALSRAHSRYAGLDPLSHFSALDFSAAMPDCLLVKLDMATMAHGLEARCPFLDHELVESCATLDWGTIFCGRGTKPLLRNLARRYLPDDLIHAPKRGFEIPLVSWMQDKLYEMVRENCLDPSGIVVDLFEREQLEVLFERKSRLDVSQWAIRLWTLFMLSLWDKEHNR